MVKETENAVKKGRSVKKSENITPAAAVDSAAQADDADKVGTMLQKERIKKGVDLQEVSQVLCIRRFYLQAIEDGNYAELPPLPYSAGFVNSYAKYLGLNNARITQLFREELDIKPEHKGIFIVEEPTSEASTPHPKYIIGSLAALMVVALLWSLFFTTEQEEEIPVADFAPAVTEEKTPEVEYFATDPKPDEVSTAAEETATAAPSENAEPEQIVIKEENFPEEKIKAAATAPAPATGVEVKITKDDTWIEVRDDKKIYINKVLHPGESYKVPSGKGMILSVGKYDGVEVRIDGVLTPVVKPNHKMNIKLDNFAGAR